MHKTISLVTFAALGTKQNLKTPDIQPVIEESIRQGSLQQIICLLHTNFPFRNTVRAIPACIWYPLRAFERLARRSVPRQKLEALFDFFASIRLEPAGIALLHAGYSLPRTLARAKRQGAVTVDLTVMAHPAASARLEREELALLGYEGQEGAFSKLAAASRHATSFDHIVAMSEFVRESYIEQGYPRERMSLACPDIDTERFVPNSDAPKTFRVLYMAYTTPLKGLHYLLDAWESLQLPGAELVLVGGYGDLPRSLKESYEARIAKNPSIVQHESTVFPEREYAEATIFAFPSLTEGFGRVTLEAMSSGVPVITTENARGLVEDGISGYVVPIRDSSAIAEKIRFFYDHPEEVVRQGAAARSTVEAKRPFGAAVLVACEHAYNQQENYIREGISVREREV